MKQRDGESREHVTWEYDVISFCDYPKKQNNLSLGCFDSGEHFASHLGNFSLIQCYL